MKRKIEKNQAMKRKQQKKAKAVPKRTAEEEKAYQEYLQNLNLMDHLNAEYSSEEGVQKAKKTFGENKPFPYLHLKNFFKDLEFVKDVKQETLALKYWEKNNDLYHFLQTKDLQKNAIVEENEHLRKLRDVLYSPSFRGWLEEVCSLKERGIKLNPSIDMFVSCYRDTHHLLCHDDELEKRRIAYIIYLVPEDWSEADGGHLDLYNCDPKQMDQPVSIGGSVLPSFNSISFFEVSTISYHRVREVLRAIDMEEDRIAITGWLYSDTLVERPDYTIEDIAPLTYEEVSTVETPAAHLDVAYWLGESYVKEDIRKAVNEQFCNESSIELRSFLSAQKFDTLYEEFKSLKEDQFDFTIPANRRHFLRLNSEKLEKSSELSKFYEFAKSQVFVDYLKEITSLPIKKINLQGRRFRPGDYALVQNTPVDEVRLDVLFRLCPKDWDFDFGAGVTYMDEEEELLSILPEPNTISIVLRDTGVQTFVKYVTHHAPGDVYDFLLTCETEIPEGSEGDWDDDEEGEEGEEEGAEEAEEEE
ncbi:proline hydroxylase [Naegleria gruberi]|uniref:Proline hydroxylase n=1 Tax=Naegleria gruberi TaxID=5762 RepID=D2VBE8_NAEGR|nr:proline hydroxylase [Naegleria gruberi]EFC45784.1 proline hydroxylase [Naegleria gruberi]|eukprot:XP_002678528.1 proline hydroxylase [Naegleria gruberi strain NEG-M]